MTISLCMIVKNEEAMLPRCLESVRHVADEMVVVDTGSTDHTVEIAESFGARVLFYPWDGSFSNARNFAMDRAEMDWILILDADSEFEREDTDKLREMVSGRSAATAYYCTTLSYLGETPDPANMLSNLNICLVKNHMGYRFAGDIHEQIICRKPEAATVTAISDVRIYHYGYLSGPNLLREKRERNIAMIQRVLNKNPGDKFMHYCLGNEYCALEKVPDALECYLKSYEDFSPDRGYGAKLLLRIVGCYDALGKTAEELAIIEEGLRFYPQLTDLEFVRGTVWLQKGLYYKAESCYKKCLAMGEPPPHLRSISGAGTFKAAHMLCQLHYNLGDPAGAMRYGRMALKYQPDNRDVLKLIAKLLMEEMPPAEAVKKLSRVIRDAPQKNLVLSDVFYALRRWETALGCARKAARSGEDTNTARYDQGACLFFLKRYGEACALFRQLLGTPHESRAMFFSRLCAFFGSGVKADMPRCDEPYSSVLERFEALMAGRSCMPLFCCAEPSRPYTGAIFSLLEVLLVTEHFDEFHKARGLLNLVADDSALLMLGKLYFHHGYLKLAYRELERSLKLTGKTDAEALRMMKYILESKALAQPIP
jgi:tetratricopeptide (TPR) repeat protein